MNRAPNSSHRPRRPSNQESIATQAQGMAAAHTPEAPAEQIQH